MWPFTVSPKPEWVTHIRQVRKTVHLVDGTTVVAYVQETGITLKSAPAPENYHFEARARYWDNEWTDGHDFLSLTSGGKTVAINRAMITRIDYEVK